MLFYVFYHLMNNTVKNFTILNSEVSNGQPLKEVKNKQTNNRVTWLINQINKQTTNYYQV